MLKKLKQLRQQQQVETTSGSETTTATTNVGEQVKQAQKQKQQQQQKGKQSQKANAGKNTKKPSQRNKSNKNPFDSGYKGDIKGLDLTSTYEGVLTDVEFKKGRFERATIVFVDDSNNIQTTMLHRLAMPANMTFPKGKMPALEFNLQLTDNNNLTAVNVKPKSEDTETGEIIRHVMEGLPTLVSYSIVDLVKTSFTVTGDTVQEIADNLASELDVMGIDADGNLLVRFED
jgi:ATPase subunit of ABC transporter with duplicated ATPase domains